MNRPSKPRHDRLLAVDVETVADRALLPDGRPPGEYAKSVHHQVVAISIVEARIETSGGSQAFIVEECRSGGEANFDEIKLLAGFWRFFAARRPRLVTWHGRGHDMPVLTLRAMMHGLDVRAWTEVPGYRYRYSAEDHCDLVDQMSDYGASLRMTLDETAVAFGLPGKIAEGNGDVESLYRQGRLAEIRSYCEADALNLIALYIMWAASTGISSEADRDRGLAALRAFLEKRREDRPHFGMFVDRWPMRRRAPATPPHAHPARPNPPPRRAPPRPLRTARTGPA